MSRLYARSDHFNEYAHPSLPYSPGTDHQIIAPIYPIRRHQERSISDYGEKVTKGKGWFSGARKWIYGVVFLLLVALVIGITVWKVQERKNSGNNSSTSSSPNEVQFISGTAGVVKSRPSDPSDFKKDPRFHKSFYGIAYTPFLAQEPWCGATLANITEDIQLLSQLTTRIRMYGAGCNQSALVLQAIQDTKVEMTVWLGVWIDTNTTTVANQMQTTLDVLKVYGTKHVAGVTVGNEYILNAADQTQATTFIIQQMAHFRAKLLDLNLGVVLPVGTSDAGSLVTTTLAEGSDFIQANVHPFFGGVEVHDAAEWTWLYFHENDIAATTAAPNHPPAYIAETGWPTASTTVENATYRASVAGLGNLQIFLDNFVCNANANGTKYFFFSFFDEPWKEQYGGVEPFWGLADSNKILKNLVLPSCSL